MFFSQDKPNIIGDCILLTACERPESFLRCTYGNLRHSHNTVYGWNPSHERTFDEIFGTRSVFAKTSATVSPPPPYCSPWRPCCCCLGASLLPYRSAGAATTWTTTSTDRESATTDARAIPTLPAADVSFRNTP